MLTPQSPVAELKNEKAMPQEFVKNGFSDLTEVQIGQD